MDPDWGQGAVNNDIDWGKAALSNNIYWGYSHYLSNSGDTNITGEGGTPPPAMERYSITDCVGFFSGNLNTIEYPQGTFQIEDRILFDYEGLSTFGFINDISTESVEEIEITGVGINNVDCFDSNLLLNAFNSFDGNFVYFSVELQSVDADFVSTNNEYPLYVYYYNSGIAIIFVQNDDEDYYDEVSFSWAGSLTLNNYNFGANGEYEIISEAKNTGYEVVDIIEDYVLIDMGLTANAINYTLNDCTTNYFLRLGTTQYGSTFNASFRNDDC